MIDLLKKYRFVLVIAAIIITSVFIVIILWNKFWFMVFASTIPQGAGPSPREVIVISSVDYGEHQILKVLDTQFQQILGSQIDKKHEKIIFDDGSEFERFPYYEYAYWYPYNDSDFYGIALVKWESGFEGAPSEHIMDIYSEDENCELCVLVTKTLIVNNIQFETPCREELLNKDIQSDSQLASLALVCR